MSRKPAGARSGNPCHMVRAHGQAPIASPTIRSQDAGPPAHREAVIGLKAENTTLRRELDETRRQQSAAAEVLKVISRSTFDLQTVLNTIAETAQRLCQSEQAYILRLDGGRYRLAGAKDADAGRVEYLRTNPIKPGRGSMVGRVALDRRTVQIADAMADPEYTLPMVGARGAFRTMLGVPLLRDGIVAGVIVLTRSFVQPFTDQQIGLVSTFADQAVIAIENARLFDAEQQRTRELTEALEQQTATSEVLQVISSSPGELEPVFQAMLENATRICEAKFGILFRYDDGEFRAVCDARRHAGITEDYLQPRADSGRGPTIRLGARRQHKADRPRRGSHAEQAYAEREPFRMAAAELGRRANACSRADAQGGRADRRHRHLPPGGAAVHRQADRAGAELRRPGRHRHREHAAAQRAAPAHRRSHRVAGAADRDLRGAEGHLQLAGRAGAGVPGHAGERDAHLRGQVRHAVAAIDGDAFRTCRAARRAAGIRRVAASASRSVQPGQRDPRARHARPSSRPYRRHRADAGYLDASPSVVPSSNSPAPGRISSCRCSRTTSWSAPSSSTARRCALHRQADRAGAELRRAGRHRHREHAAAQRAAPAHRRSDRGAGAADRDLARC